MRKKLKIYAAVLCISGLITGLLPADAVWAGNIGKITKTSGIIQFEDPVPDNVPETDINIGIDTEANTEENTEENTETTSTTDNININISGGDSVDISAEDILENENSLATEINVEVPASVHIDPNAKINKGIYADNVDISGLTYKEAKSKIENYISQIRNTQIELASINDRVTTVSAGDLGVKWSNSDILIEAVGLGKTGNIIARYKANKDLEVEHKVYDVNVKADKASVRNVVAAESDECGSEAKDATMKRENGVFYITEGQEGFGIDVDKSVDSIMDIMDNWDKNSTRIELVSGMIQPKGKAEDLEKVCDLLGHFSTSFSSSGRERSGNVRNGTKLINGKLLYPGEQLSVYETVSPFTEDNGYYLAGSYQNGLVVESLGGGICQVSSTLYNAVLRAELQVDERYNHSMIVNYVDMSSDAAISGTAKDFKFTNSLENPIYIEGYTTDDKQVVFNIYGVEYRPSNRKISFESVELEKKEPEGEKVVADPSLPVGEIHVQSPHTGYRGEYWKIIQVDGVETERVRINKSTYQAVPKTASVGTAADNPEITNMVKAAIATGSIESCKAMVAQLKEAAAAATLLVPAAPVAETPEVAPAQAEQPQEEQPQAEQPQE
ncbi:MAG: VanW family protein [Lachnospiraceae bacterium]|nr:VanW family protein [Lachnospiraceae bacterium]